jgi:hypothetical protein
MIISPKRYEQITKKMAETMSQTTNKNLTWRSIHNENE